MRMEMESEMQASGKPERLVLALSAGLVQVVIVRVGYV